MFSFFKNVVGKKVEDSIDNATDVLYGNYVQKEGESDEAYKARLEFLQQKKLQEKEYKLKRLELKEQAKLDRLKAKEARKQEKAIAKQQKKKNKDASP